MPAELSPNRRDPRESPDDLVATLATPALGARSRECLGEPRELLSDARLLAELPAICDDLLLAYQAEEYKANFGWIDQLALVRNEDRIAELNDLLVAQLQTGDTGTTHLAMPEPINWEDNDCFTIGGTRGHEYEDLDLDEYMEQLGDDRDEFTLDRCRCSRPQYDPSFAVLCAPRMRSGSDTGSPTHAATYFCPCSSIP